MRRLLLVVVIVLAGVAAYIAVRSDEANEVVPSRTAATPARTFTLRRGDVAVYGKVRCLATIEGGAPYLLCSSRPRTRARYEVAIWPDGVNVFRLGNPDPIYSTP
jgi:hypothetical protein